MSPIGGGRLQPSLPRVCISVMYRLPSPSFILPHQRVQFPPLIPPFTLELGALGLTFSSTIIYRRADPRNWSQVISPRCQLCAEPQGLDTSLHIPSTLQTPTYHPHPREPGGTTAFAALQKLPLPLDGAAIPTEPHGLDPAWSTAH